MSIESLKFDDFYSGSSEVNRIFDNVRLRIPSYNHKSEDYLNSLSFNDDVFLAVLTYLHFNPGTNNKLPKITDMIWKNFGKIGRVSLLADFTDSDMQEPLIYEGIYEVELCKGYDMKDINKEILVGYIRFENNVFAPVMTYPFNFVSRSKSVDQSFIESVKKAIITLGGFIND